MVTPTRQSGSRDSNEPPVASRTSAPEHAQTIAAANLLAIESKVRAASNERELLHLIADETRKLVSARQVIVLRQSRPHEFTVSCISSIPLLDRDTPFVRWIEALSNAISLKHPESETVAFDLPAYTDPNSMETKSYPFGHLIWRPMRLAGGGAFAALLLARERPWSEADIKLIARESDVFANMWQALYGARVLQSKPRVARRTKLMIAASALLAALYPVSMTALAPVEIVAKDPQRITAPIDGVIAQVLVDPNRPVTKGQTILTFDDTTARSRLQIAEQEFLLAKARLDRTIQASFASDQARHELNQARAEFELKKVERDYATDLLAKSRIVADRDGILIYADRDRLIGKPTKTGERLMQIIDPTASAARIELPVADAIVLERGAKARLFLDADPLQAVTARIISHGYHAEPNSTLQLVYRLNAEIETRSAAVKVGARGTAQVQSDQVPLVYFLLRRPISAFRQYVGV